jgi:hypothetical protein
MTIHKGITTLYKLILKQSFIWYGLYADVKNYIKNCVICQEMHKSIYKKPNIKSIINNYPKERYVMDLVSLDKRIDDEYHRYKYIFNIIDHFSKYLGFYLIENKTSKEVLYCLKDFIIKHGKCDILQCDNGREFSNNIINNYCTEKDIKLIHSSPYHPQTNGVVERIRQSVIKSLITLKIKCKNKYDLKVAILRQRMPIIHQFILQQKKYQKNYLIIIIKNYLHQLRKILLKLIKILIILLFL